MDRIPRKMTCPDKKREKSLLSFFPSLDNGISLRN